MTGVRARVKADADALHQVAGDEGLEDQRRDLGDEVDLGEDAGAHVEVVAEGGHHLEAREVDERHQHGQDQHVGGDAQQVGRPEHRAEPFPRAAADALVGDGVGQRLGLRRLPAGGHAVHGERGEHGHGRGTPRR
jgi:hypothetical protein